MNAHGLIHLFPSLLRSKRLPGLCWYLNPKTFWMESGMTWPPCSQAVLQVWGWCRTCPGPKKRKIEIDAFRGTTENSSHSRACYFYQHIDFTYWLYVFGRARLTPSPHIPHCHLHPTQIPSCFLPPHAEPWQMGDPAWEELILTKWILHK